MVATVAGDARNGVSLGAKVPNSAVLVRRLCSMTRMVIGTQLPLGDSSAVVCCVRHKNL